MIKNFFVYLCLLFIFNLYLNADDQSIELSVLKISKNIRCLVCQGQSVYDSQTDFAISVRDLIKKNLKEGKSDKEIYDYLKAKYGEWIIYEPKFDKNTYLLWILPLILFVFGGLVIFRNTYKSSN